MSTFERVVNLGLRASGSLKSRLRVRLLRFGGARVGDHCWLRKISVPRNPWDIELADHVALDDGVVLLTTGERNGTPRIRVDRGVYINRHTMIDASLSISVGPQVMIGPFCYITDHDHGTEPAQSVSAQPLIEAPVVIGRNVWLGAGVIVLKGVTIGDGAVVGAGSVVTRSIMPGARVAGVPARAVRAMVAGSAPGPS